MSRTGKLPIVEPEGAKVALVGRQFSAEGPKGKVSQDIVDGIEVQIEDRVVTLTRLDDTGRSRAKHGLMRALLANAVKGVTQGFQKELELVGVGYRAELQGRDLHFRLGFSHPVIYSIAAGVSVELGRQNTLTISGADRQKVGQVTAEIRGLRPPDAYKGKGFRYKGEVLRLKVGKAGVN